MLLAKDEDEDVFDFTQEEIQEQEDSRPTQHFGSNVDGPSSQQS